MFLVPGEALGCPQALAATFLMVDPPGASRGPLLAKRGAISWRKSGAVSCNGTPPLVGPPHVRRATVSSWLWAAGAALRAQAWHDSCSHLAAPCA